ncbi:hypothetical protein MMC21_000673 [Puttea exsequens]|nr:hypothetical protein [Puttea exsequens]
MPCFYDQQTASKASDRLGPHETRLDDIRHRSNSAASVTSANTLDFSESRERRMRELRLLHHYATKTANCMLGENIAESDEFWNSILPDLAFDSDPLLYSLLSLSALHSTKNAPNDKGAEEAYRNYLDLSIRGHSIDIENTSRENADSLCLTASVLRICAFTMLQDHSLSPYMPPMQWFQVSYGTGQVFHATWDWIEKNESSIAWRVLNRPPYLSPFNETLWAHSNRQGFEDLLRRSQEDEQKEPWDSDVQEAYTYTISYIGSIQNALSAAQESGPATARRLIAFPILIPRRFIGLVEEQQPRALVVLAYYFAQLARFSKIWWIGDSGKRHVRGLLSILPLSWHDLMAWPLTTMEEEYIMPS